jgi:ABC-2 type transport system permease protein
MLPQVWQKIAMVNPMLYCINGLRFGYIGVSDVALGTATGLVLGLSVVMFAWCYLLFRSGYKIKT